MARGQGGDSEDELWMSRRNPTNRLDNSTPARSFAWAILKSLQPPAPNAAPPHLVCNSAASDSRALLHQALTAFSRAQSDTPQTRRSSRFTSLDKPAKAERTWTTSARPDHHRGVEPAQPAKGQAFPDNFDSLPPRRDPGGRPNTTVITPRKWPYLQGVYFGIPTTEIHRSCPSDAVVH